MKQSTLFLVAGIILIVLSWIFWIPRPTPHSHDLPPRKFQLKNARIWQPPPRPSHADSPPPRLNKRPQKKARLTAPSPKKSSPPLLPSPRTKKLREHLNREGKLLGLWSQGQRFVGLPQKNSHAPVDSEVARSFQIWLISSSGHLQTIHPQKRIATFHSDPTHKAIAFTTPQKVLFLAQATNLNQAQKIDSSVGYHFSFSHSGKYLAYIKNLSIDLQEIVVYNIEQKTYNELSHRSSSLARPIFSPDDSELIFLSGATGILSIWKIALPNGTAFQLTNRNQKLGTGLGKQFIPSYTGKVLWAHHWIIYEAEQELWALRDDGTFIQKIGPFAGWFRWQQKGVSIIYRIKEGKIRTFRLPF